MLRRPVWNSSGSSSSIRYWLNEKPPGIDGGEPGADAVQAGGHLVDAGADVAVGRDGQGHDDSPFTPLWVGGADRYGAKFLVTTSRRHPLGVATVCFRVTF
jgi:hypothetical protein